MKTTDLLVVGGGPAGLSAASAAAEHGVSVILVDRQPRLGGQLIKQTHKFFGSREQHAGHRGIEIAERLGALVQAFDNVEVMTEAEALGYYSDGVVTIDHQDRWVKFETQIHRGGDRRVRKAASRFPTMISRVYGAGQCRH